METLLALSRTTQKTEQKQQVRQDGGAGQVLSHDLRAAGEAGAAAAVGAS